MVHSTTYLESSVVEILWHPEPARFLFRVCISLVAYVFERCLLRSIRFVIPLRLHPSMIGPRLSPSISQVNFNGDEQ